jgi:benzylsuccinate CoA-transferase BbsF subunit
MTNQPILHNIRILDFTWVLAGPYATRLLADFGAEVIKVQPLLLSEVDDSFSRGYFEMWNRNKLGISLNPGKPEGVALAKRLVSICDAVVESFTPRVMDNWGLDYNSLRRVKPDIIMLSLSAMGHTGPWRHYPGFGPTIQAFSGMTYLTSYPGMAPAGMGFSYADHVAGLYASLALLGALEHRQQTGEGQYIDLSQLETMAGLLGSAIMDNAQGQEVLPSGNRSVVAAPHNVYRCKGDDRWCAVAVFTDEEWLGFKRVLGNPLWADNEKYAALAGRLDNIEELDRLVEAWTKQYTAEEVMSLLQQEGVAAGVVQNASDLAKDPQLTAQRFFIKSEHTEAGKITTDPTPIKLDDAPAPYRRASPTIGRDNSYVYGQLLGLGESKIAQLRKNGII